MIDLHCHLLPGIDDGPRTADQAIELARQAVNDGITHAIVTPHVHPGRWDNTLLDIASGHRELTQVLELHGVALQLGFAGEVRLTDQLMRQVEQCEIPFFGAYEGYQIMLLEFPHSHVPPGTKQLVGWLRRHGIRPLIAHPERNAELAGEPGKLAQYLDAGALVQLTGASLLGRFGERSANAANEFLRRDWVSVVASDGHNATTRRPVLSAVHSELTRVYGLDRARRLLLETPAAICADQFSAFEAQPAIGLQ